MPQAVRTATSIPYHLKTFIGGFSDYQDKGIAGSFKCGANLSIRDQEDSITAGQALKDDLAVGTMAAPAYFVVPSSDGNTYFFCYDGKIYSRHSDATYHLVYTDTNEAGHIIGAGEWYDDQGWTYVLWATPTRLNIKKLLGPAYSNVEAWNDVNVASTGSWPKTNLTSTTWHTMAMANGTFQICNGNVMAFVGYDLSYTNNALALIPGNLAKCIVERSKYGIIGCTRADNKDETALFSWDGIGLHWNDKQIMKWGGLNSMIDTEIAIAQIGTDGQFYVSDFTSPMPFRKIRGGGRTDPDGVAAYHGMALFGIWGNTNYIHGTMLANGVYTLGRVNKNAPIVLNLEYQLTCDEITSVKVVGTDILIAYKLNGAYGVKIVDKLNKATGIYQSLDLDIPMGTRRYTVPMGRVGGWDKVDLQLRPLPAGTAIEVWYKYDKRDTGGLYNDGWIQANTDPGNTAGGTQLVTTGSQNAVFYVGEKARTLEVMVKVIPNGNETPDLHELNVYFSIG